MVPDTEQKRLMLEAISKDYQADGPLPPVSDISSCLSQMDPHEMAEAIYFLEYQTIRNSFSQLALLRLDGLEEKFSISHIIQGDLRKIFLSVAEHFRRGSSEVTPMVDQMFHYFHRVLVCMAMGQKLSSLN